MKKSKNHSNKEAAESADKEVVVINKKKSDDNDDDDDDDVGKTEDHKKPKVFQSKSNLEIIAWLVDHPEILRLVLEMNKTDVAISSSNKIMDVNESVKCLFLHARSPRGEVFDENKFNQIILTSVEEFKEIRKNSTSTESLSQKKLIDYIDEEFVQKMLSRQLVAVNISELIRNGGFNILVDFVRETFI
ncbi:hypothetical protein RhiirA5_506114 [Rhizophagus irregularis]|uniref:Uncharacterized protein n=1 Tax=Rhizophagus irregularis TaxID=588596 RepID=A0A2N0NVI0_9GLOM|nr:hypothetical protein RhiirA5_506114 [Rhizophagus irregularis]